MDHDDPIELAATAVNRAGPWTRWSLDRQLWYLRVSADLTQAELARRSGICQARLSRLEAGGDMKLSTLKRLFAALGWEVLLLPVAQGWKTEARPFRKQRRQPSRRGS